MIRSGGPFVHSVHLIISTVRVFYGGLREFYFICWGDGGYSILLSSVLVRTVGLTSSLLYYDLMHIVSCVTDFF